MERVVARDPRRAGLGDFDPGLLRVAFPYPSVSQPAPVHLLHLVLALAVFCLAACGGSSTPGVANAGSSTTPVTTAPGGTAGSSGSVSADQLKFAECMQTHGEPDYPEPGGNAQANAMAAARLDPTSPRFQGAEHSCQDDLPRGGAASPAEQEKVEAQALKYAHCMQTHGMPNWPDPSAGGYMVAPAGSEASSPVYLRAARACASSIPTG